VFEQVANMNFAALLKEHFPDGLPGEEGTNQDEESPGFNYSDLGNAERLVHYHGKDLRYCHQWGKWLIWDKTHWKEDITGEIVRKSKDTVKRIYQEASEETDKKERRMLAAHAMRSEAEGKIRAMISLAKSEAEIHVTTDELDADHWKLNCLNGVIDLKTGKLMPHKREYMMTKIAPVNYEQSATCPTWEAFLHKIMGGKEELIEFLQRSVGYSLTGDISEHVMFILYGSGRNGKSTFANTIRDMLGGYADQANPESFMVKKNESSISNDIASLKGLRLVSTAEGEEGKRLAESLVKQITGGEPLKARFLRQEHFTFAPQFKLWFSTNHKPNIRGTDNGIWRRLCLIPFAVTIPTGEVDKSLPDKLKAEYAGILNWAIEGCTKWQKDGLKIPEEVQAATESYRGEMDALGAFIDECCITNPLAKVLVKDLYEVYEEWCEEGGEYTVKKRVLSQKLQDRGFKVERGTGNKMFCFGLGLQSEVPVTDSYQRTKEPENKVTPFNKGQKKVTDIIEQPTVSSVGFFEEGEL
jgi:putative DNA primase/helicase